MTQIPPPPGTEPNSIKARLREPYPSVGWTFRALHRLVVFGFGSGLLRPASGTWGTLAAWLLWHVVDPYVTSDLTTGLFLALAFAYGCWACHKVCLELNTHDHLGMVWDEMVAFWLVLWLSPSGWWPELVAFLLFRAFDVVKPPPIKYCDKHVKGGIGVMFDDLLAAIYAIVLMQIAVLSGGFG